MGGQSQVPFKWDLTTETTGGVLKDVLSKGYSFKYLQAWLQEFIWWERLACSLLSLVAHSLPVVLGQATENKGSVVVLHHD